MDLKITLTLTEGDLQHFRRAIRGARKTLDEVGEEAVIKAAADLIERVRKTREVPDFVDERIEQLELFLEMVRDEHWGMPADQRRKVMTSLAYFSDPNDIIPDSIPGIGFLDDAIMVELVLRELRHEIEAYRDFRLFGHTDKEGRSEGVVDERRFREKRESLRKRIRRRGRRDADRASQRGWKLSLW